MNIELKNIAKRYSGNVNYTLENINLKIESGEFVVLLGPSGCGKTTLLRMIAGLSSITKGEMIFGRIKVNNVEPKNRDLAMVFQTYALYPHLTIYKNMAYSLKVRGFKKEFIDKRVKSVAKILEIDHLLFNKPSEISGGQRQRVALGRAIVRKPSIFLMDEPLSNLDAKLRETMRVELVKIHNLIGATTIYVTHDQLEAMTMANKIVLFNDKVIQQVGTPFELYNYPKNIFVANFIGSPSMNFIRLFQSSGTWYIQNSKMQFYLSEKLKNILKKRKEIILGVRAENLKIVKMKTENSIEAKIVVSELIGKETIVTALYSYKKSLKIVIPNQVQYQQDSTIFAQVNESQIHLFDAETKRRIS